MSQAGIISISGGGGGGSPIETVTGDDAVVVSPIGNNINLVGGTSTDNNPNGIQTSGNNGTATETFSLTNRATGTATTIGATSSNIITFPLGATPGTYQVTIEIVAFNASTPAGAGYQIFGCARTTGAAAATIGSPTKVVNEEGALAACDVDVTPSGNNLIVSVTGTAGLTINWFALLTYVFVS